MQAADPLAQLHDIVLPQPVGWWPLAWGWWVLLALVIILAAIGIFFQQREKKRQRYRAAASDELNHLLQHYQQDQNAAHYLQQLSILLRRTAISAQPHTFPVDVKGEAWLQWLDNNCPETKQGFSVGPGRALLTGPYEAHPDIDVDSLHALVKLWLRQHRNQWQKNRSPSPTRALPARAAPAEVKHNA